MKFITPANFPRVRLSRSSRRRRRNRQRLPRNRSRRHRYRSAHSSPVRCKAAEWALRHNRAHLEGEAFCLRLAVLR